MDFDTVKVRPRSMVATHTRRELTRIDRRAQNKLNSLQYANLAQAVADIELTLCTAAEFSRGNVTRETEASRLQAIYQVCEPGERAGRDEVSEELHSGVFEKKSVTY